MNPNVAIELGYALKALTDRNILMVMNTHYGGREFLPFDLAHKAGPIMFGLPPDADTSMRNSVRAGLARSFVRALKPYLTDISSRTVVRDFEATPATNSPAVYFQQGEVLATLGEAGRGRVEYSYIDTRGFYLRLLPREPLARPLVRQDALDNIRRVGLCALHRRLSSLHAANKYGAIAIEPRLDTEPELVASAQLFTGLQGIEWVI